MASTSPAGVHPAYAALRAARELHDAIRDLADDETHPDRVGLTLAAGAQAQVADALDRNWQVLLPILADADRTHHRVVEYARAKEARRAVAHARAEEAVAEYAAAVASARHAQAERIAAEREMTASDLLAEAPAGASRRAAFIGPGEIA